ncbi:hypothetical protein Tco_0396400 [Tanacetum coccineum]
MAFFVILISSYSSEESVGTSTARVILFGTISTTIPPTTPTIDLPYTSPLIDTDLSDSDNPDSPPSQDLYKTTVAQWRSRVAARSSPPSSPIRQILLAPPGLPCRPAILVLPGQSIPIGRSYRTQTDGTSYDSPTATSERPSRKRCRSPSVPISSPIRGALSPVHADLSTPPKRIRDSDSVTDLEVSSEDGYEPYIPRECITYTDAIRVRGMDDRDVVETATEEEVESRQRDMVEVEVDLRVGPIIKDGVREPVKKDVLDHVITDGAVEVTNEKLGGLVQRFHDHVVEIPVHQIQVIESEQRLQGYRITGVDLEVTTMTEAR